MSTNNSFAMDRAANAFDTADLSTVTRSPLTIDIPRKASSFAIATSGTFTDNGSSNFAGDLNNPFDDARLYAGSLTINGMPMFSGFGAAISVGPGAVVPEAVRQRWTVENLAQAVTIDVPAYVLPTLPGTDYSVDVRSLSLNNAADVVRVFGDGGLPSIVYFTGGSLALPDQVSLKNVTIVVENGDLNFNGDRHLLENVTIVVRDGAVNLGSVETRNLAVYSANGIHVNQGAWFSGKNLLMTEHGDVIFNGETSSAPIAQALEVIAHGNIYLNGAVDVHARFLASGSFIINYDSSVVGSIRSQGGVTFNANVHVSTEVQPLIGIIDTGFNGGNPDIDYNRIILGRDRINNDDNPFLIPGIGNEHGTHILGIIGATQNNGFGIDGINDQAPIWLGRAVGSGSWADSLIEFVDTAKKVGQPHSIVNLSFDLTQRDANGRVTIRYELTPQERTALEYARQNGVLVVVPAGNDGSVSSVLGQASQEFSNIITVGALGSIDDSTPTAYSNRGRGLNIMAVGGDLNHPVISTVGSNFGSMVGTSVAAAEVTGAASRVWEMNPTLNAVQIKEILLKSAIDLGVPGWDIVTGSGRLNLEGAVSLAQQTPLQSYITAPYLIPTTWGGEGKVTPMERPASLAAPYIDTVNMGVDPISQMRLGTLNAFNEVDYYTFTLTNLQQVSISFAINGVASNTGVIITLHDSTGKNLGQLDSNFIGPQIIRSLLEPGSYSIEINAGLSSLDANSQYTIQFGTDVIIAPPNPDPGGDNSSPSGGSIPTPVTISDLFLPIYQQNQSKLGSPISKASSINAGVTQQQFTKGAIVGSNFGNFIIDGSTWIEFINRGGVNGSLGVPIKSSEDLGNGNTAQMFEKGLLIISNNKSYVIPPSPVLDCYMSEGGAGGWLGSPTSNIIDSGNGFFKQDFEHGYIVSNGQKTIAYEFGQEVSPNLSENFGVRQDVARMSYVDKLMLAAGTAIGQMPGDIQRTLSNPAFWAQASVLFIIVAELQATPIGPIIDAAFLLFFGVKSVVDLGAFFIKAGLAETQDELQDAANSFKEFVSDIGPIAVAEAFKLVRAKLPKGVDIEEQLALPAPEDQLLLPGPVKVSPGSVKDLLKGTVKIDKTIYRKDGGLESAWQDFYDFTGGASNIKGTGKGVFVAKMPDGSVVNGRGFSSGGPPTIEIQVNGKSTKIRYAKYNSELPRQSLNPPFGYLPN